MRALGGVAEPDRPLAALAEGHTRCEADACLEQQVAAEPERVVESLDAREEVEGAVGARHRHPGHRRERVEAEVAVRPQHREHLEEAGLAVAQRDLGRLLGEARRVGDDELVQLRRLRHEVAAADEPPDAPTRHAVGLRERLDRDDRVVAGCEPQDRGSRLTIGAAVPEPVVHLVREQPEVVRAAEVEQPLLLLDRRNPAEWVRRRGDEQHARARRDRRLDRVEVDAVAVADERLRRRRPGSRSPCERWPPRSARPARGRSPRRLDRARTGSPRLSACTPEAVTTISPAGIELDPLQPPVRRGELAAERRAGRRSRCTVVHPSSIAVAAASRISRGVGRFDSPK